MSIYYERLALPIMFKTIFPSVKLEGEQRYNAIKRGFGINDVDNEFIAWLNTHNLSISQKRWNRYFECPPNQNFNIHADTVDVTAHRTKLNITFNHYDTDVVFYKTSVIDHQKYVKGPIRIYPPEVCQETYRINDPLPCILNSSEIHTVRNRENRGHTWICYSLTLTDLYDTMVSFEYVKQQLKDYLI